MPIKSIIPKDQADSIPKELKDEYKPNADGDLVLQVEAINGLGLHNPGDMAQANKTLETELTALKAVLPEGATKETIATSLSRLADLEKTAGNESEVVVKLKGANTAMEGQVNDLSADLNRQERINLLMGKVLEHGCQPGGMMMAAKELADKVMIADNGDLALPGEDGKPKTKLVGQEMVNIPVDDLLAEVKQQNHGVGLLFQKAAIPGGSTPPHVPGQQQPNGGVEDPLAVRQSIDSLLQKNGTALM